MKRLLSTLLCDIHLQFRNGFYWAAGFVALAWIVILRQLPMESLSWLMPVFLLMGTFYFVAGLVLLEKREGTLTAQVVTPLREWEYLASKVLSLSALALLETLLIATLGGLSFRVIPLSLGIGSGAVIMALAGFVSVSRYSSINEYLFPSFLITLVFVPPFLNYLKIFESSLNYLHPLQPALTLTAQAFEGGELWRSIYGLAGSLFWMALALGAAMRAYRRFVVATEGGTP